ncbi:MAG: HEAT repeat domain-containing protein [Acidimicrobiia bacterium]|nr:HEAT repeat domain-containing protein [Acidimicrobiia bacterium]MBT8193274.1 HEAT repeat domain-containing protein [Acidimicrobiia bacterium]NNF87327.1 HEAT repeat domain-containing protein [Acidimicrobiia bacterium]NNJ47787.1 HEAT repeat domain-containing protein [Acidimicrobiia bacterium]NNL14201.1 HEAT repeat domain-containing protein [Acidimicrobiia bacterium]
MQSPPSDLDDARRRVAAAELVAVASNHLTDDLYSHLEFSDLVAVKNLLKKFFSAQPWSAEDAERLDMFLRRNVDEPVGWFEHDLGAGLTLLHGFDQGTYRLWATGGSDDEASIFDRVFSGPVQPEATPNPRHVRFVIGGDPAPGVWFRRGDDLDDERVATLLEDADITDVLVAGDFVAIGLRRAAMWKDRLDDLVATVTELFWTPERIVADLDGPTRDELVAGQTGGALHLLDPDDPASRATLETAAASDDPRQRRMAVATLAQSADEGFAMATLRSAYSDPSRIVRRTVIDVAVDLESEQARNLLEQALADEDDWIRWKAVKGISELGLSTSAAAVTALADDRDFQVRFEVAAALRG